MENSRKDIEKQKQERIGVEKLNNEGCLMKCVEYNTSIDVLVEFQDKCKAQVRTRWDAFVKGQVRNPKKKIGMIGTNKLGYPMEIVDYVDCENIYVRFIGGKTITHASFRDFREGNVKNWDSPTVYGHGIIGNMVNQLSAYGKSKEYKTWCAMLERCYNEENLKKRPTYEQCEVCKEWMYFENFYNWLHNQENFEKWISLNRSSIDKDIIVKHNKVYSPDTCCLVPLRVNSLFIRQESTRGEFPIGVHYNDEINGFVAQLTDENNKFKYHNVFATPESAFQYYKEKKEKKIKIIAQEEYSKGNITKRCYDAMMSYEVEITD